MTKWYHFFHPFLFVMFPVLFLYANNEGEVSLRQIFLPLAVLIALTVLLWIFTGLALKNKVKGALVVSLLWVLFFSYGHFSRFASHLFIGDFIIGQPRYTLLLWGILFCAGSYFIIRARTNFHRLTNLVNVIAATLVLISVFNITYYEINNGVPDLSATGHNMDTEQVQLTPPAKLPDIYYIILDRYGSPRTLHDVYGFDNTAFLSFLTDTGFYIASASNANYPATQLSLASSLNMQYINYLVGNQESNNMSPVFKVLEDYSVWHLLKRNGYTYIHFGSWSGPTAKNRYADVNINYFKLPLTEFQRALYHTTMLYPIGRTFIFDERKEQWDRTLYQLDELAKIPDIKEPTFVFAHFLVPHDPYVFSSDGRFITSAEDTTRSRNEAYIAQIVFINNKFRELIPNILARSEVPPVIIIQSDEGPYPRRYDLYESSFNWEQATEEELRQKMGILNAYYLPDKDKSALYPSITPVNSFRIVFNLYFNSELELLPDRSYIFGDSKHPLKFNDVTEKIK
jgi:hypothetical protein